MHVHTVPVDIDSVVKAGPIRVSSKTVRIYWLLIFVGLATFFGGILSDRPELTWGAFFVNFVYFTGLSLGGVMTAIIVQIVRAKWSPPIRRLAESNIAFFPVAFLAFLTLYFGKTHLFYWANHPMPGREWWMQPDFVFARFTVLFAVLFFLFTRFVHLSLRADCGLARERDPENDTWMMPIHNFLLKGWQGSEREVIPTQRTLSTRGPVLVFCYAIFFSLFAFEMIMGMNSVWFSNLFGAFFFVSNIYIGWASLALMATFFSKHHPALAKIITTQQLWDLGKLCLGFSMLWGYMFWSQFLPQWYGNLPEETQWMILRTREFPWKTLGYTAFACAFVIPFISLLSRDLKKTPIAYATICITIMCGVWLDRYLIIMAEISPEQIPLGYREFFIFLGFLGAYLLSIRTFLTKYPVVPIASPLTHGSQVW